jgi:hypothetical protein
MEGRGMHSLWAHGLLSCHTYSTLTLALLLFLCVPCLLCLSLSLSRSASRSHGYYIWLVAVMHGVWRWLLSVGCFSVLVRSVSPPDRQRVSMRGSRGGRERGYGGGCGEEGVGRRGRGKGEAGGGRGRRKTKEGRTEARGGGGETGERGRGVGAKRDEWKGGACTRCGRMVCCRAIPTRLSHSLCFSFCVFASCLLCLSLPPLPLRLWLTRILHLAWCRHAWRVALATFGWVLVGVGSLRFSS